MAYYLNKERTEDIVGSYRRYQAYLQENRQRFPSGAFALGTAEWWQNANHEHCPHDSRLESFVVEETCGNGDEQRITTIRIRLLNRDEHRIELFYPRVIRYSLQSQNCVKGSRDWRYDEFTLSPAANMIHEIEWAGCREGEGSRWIIEASDVEFKLVPK